MTRWTIAKGKGGDLRFYVPSLGADPWSTDRDAAFRFALKADAVHVAESLILAGGDECIAVLAQPDERQEQQHAGAMRVSALIET